MSDVVRIRVVIGTGFSGASHEEELEEPRDEWEAKTKEEKDDYMQEYIEVMISNHIDGWWEVIK